MKDILLRLGRSYMKKPKKLIIDASNEIQRLRACIAALEKSDRDLRITISDMHADNVVQRNTIASLCAQIEGHIQISYPPFKTHGVERGIYPTSHELHIRTLEGRWHCTFDPDKSS